MSTDEDFPTYPGSKAEFKLFYALGVLAIVAVILIVYLRLSDHSESRGQIPLKTDAVDLKGTIVTPHLEQKMTPGKNILWCSTFQLAWNELCGLANGPVTLDPSAPVTDILNNSQVSKSDIDNSAYVARAGLVADGEIAKIQNELEQKFHGKASADLLRDNESKLEGVIAYAYLQKNLPFRDPFQRYNTSRLKFTSQPVQSFGFPDNWEQNREYIKMSTQVIIIDVRDEDDFIITILTDNHSDCLILAKVPPLSTLSETVKMVKMRIKQPHQEIIGVKSLCVPVVDFDILKQYEELTGHRIIAAGNRLNGLPLDIAAQSIKFRLDERGAVLKSEALAGAMAGMPCGPKAMDLIFDKPFLILMERSKAKNPYFALWVGNTELLNPVKTQ